MFWGCFSYNGVGQLAVVEGNMDKYQYVDIINKNLRQSAKKLKMKNYIFQQDNDPKHTSQYAQDYFEYRDIHVLR